MSIDTYTSHEAQEIRSIRSHEPCHNTHGETPEERLLREVERFRTLALEQLEQSIDGVVKNIIEEVIGREMTLLPIDVQNIVRRALRKFERESPIRLRVAPADITRVQTELPIVADGDLDSGDLVIEMRTGEVESRLPVRLSCALSRLHADTIRSVYGEVAEQTRKIA